MSGGAGARRGLAYTATGS